MFEPNVNEANIENVRRALSAGPISDQVMRPCERNFGEPTGVQISQRSREIGAKIVTRLN